ncbi:DUF108 domain-containing protein [Candidatus Woesearchaeota archaeon]|nr:DUF108 domain-containing protein [Candidatus Woesearchaeota archaeon]
MKVGIIGCGLIGSEIASFLDNNKNFELIGLTDIDKNKSFELIKNLKNSKPKLMGINEIIKKSDLIVESAAKNAVRGILSNENLDKKNKKLLIMSTSGIISSLRLLKEIKNCEILLPSGAIVGLDGIKSVSEKIESLTLTTTKPVQGLEDAPYIIKNKINIKNIKNKKVIFEGTLIDAINEFPQNINVAATLFLASKSNNLRLKIIADPKTRFNTHEIQAEGDFGVIKTTAINFPSKNPKTSYLAVLSAIQTIRNIESNIKIGN